MSGDTLKRVQAVKKWLERAESSYSSHKEITGELNLIMAQAEMQRLKETRKPSTFRKWGLRGCAMIVAALLFFGGSSVYQKMGQQEDYPAAPVEMAASETNSNESVVVPISENTEVNAIATETPAVENPSIAEAVTATPVSEKPVARQETPVVTTPVTTAPVVRPAPVPPALSEKEIQSVVGEAGRALRGQG